MVHRWQRMYLWWSSCTWHLLAHRVRVNVGDSGLCRLCLCGVFWLLILILLVCWFCAGALGLGLFQAVSRHIIGSKERLLSYLLWHRHALSVCVTINKRWFEPFYVFGSCFRTLAVTLVSGCEWSGSMSSEVKGKGCGEPLIFQPPTFQQIVFFYLHAWFNNLLILIGWLAGWLIICICVCFYCIMSQSFL